MSRPSSRKPLPGWLRCLRAIALLYGALALFACSMADRLIFMPPRPGYTQKASALVTLKTTRDEPIAAFHYPARDGMPTVLYSHGNAEDIGQSIPLYQAWRELGWGVLAYDYPGYGQSPGRPTEASAERAIEAAWAFLTADQGLSSDQIVVIGRSVGSGPSVWLADRTSPATLVLISPFTSAFAVQSPAQYILPGNRFPNLKRIRNCDTPLLVIHGEADRVIPISHGLKLHDASPADQKALFRVPGAGHNDLFHLAGQDVIDHIHGFIGSL